MLGVLLISKLKYKTGVQLSLELEDIQEKKLDNFFLVLVVYPYFKWNHRGWHVSSASTVKHAKPPGWLRHTHRNKTIKNKETGKR